MGVKINELAPNGNGKEVSSTSVSIENHNGNGETGATERYMIIDVHEPPEMEEKFQQKGIPIVVEALSSGDYIFGNIGIERKTLSDFWGSLTAKDKRIWTQMFELKRNFEKPFLVIEKFNFAYLRSPAHAKQIWGALASIALIGINIVTIVSATERSPEFVDFVNYLYFSSDKNKKTSRPLPRKADSPREVFTDCLCMIPGIGPVTGKKLIARYKDFEELCAASAEELSSLCGKTKVQFLWKILHGEDPLEGSSSTG